jgi:hypothetical protein
VLDPSSGVGGAVTAFGGELVQARNLAAELAASAAAASAAGASAVARARAKAAAAKTSSAPGPRTTSANPSTAARSTATISKVKLPAKGYAAATTTKYTGDYAFMADKSLSAQEKLILFLALHKKNASKELESMLDKASAQKASASKGSSIFDVAKSVIPALGLTDKLLGGKLEGLLKQVSGPMLGAAATALGMPALAPVAMSFGPQLVGSVLDAAAPGAAGSSTSSSSGAGKGGELDDVELARVQLLQKRVEEWTGLISNLMQSFHQTRMSVVNNLR